MKFKLKAPGTQRLKQNYDNLVSIFALNFNLRRYTKATAVTDAKAAAATATAARVGRCKLTLSNPCWNRLEVSA